MNIQPEELESLDLEETDFQDAEATIELVAEESYEQVSDVPVMEVPEVPSVPVPEVPDQELVVTPPIPVVEEPSTQEVEDVEMLDIESDESLAVENRNKQSKIKKILNYLTTKKKRAVLKRAHHLWQLRPHVVAPLSQESHECAACGTEYQGNYCPRCGQSATVGRFSFKKALLHFLNVWGMGNRSMFHSLRDLMFRPGYMIRDYLSGMQSAYFPPFKMFFILLTFSLIIEHGLGFDFNQSNAQQEKSNIESIEEIDQAIKEEEAKEKDKDKITEKPMYRFGMKFGKIMLSILDKNPAIFALLMIVLFLWPLYFFFHHTPNIPDLRFSEYIVALVYTANSFSIILILGQLFDSDILRVIAAIMVFVSFRQLTGYKKRRILVYMIISLIISTATILLVAVGIIGLLSLFIPK